LPIGLVGALEPIAMQTASLSAERTTAPLQTFDARCISGRMRHEVVCEAMENLPSGGTFRYIGSEYPIVLMEELIERYGSRLAHKVVESDADHVVMDLTLD
jgi:uncharacterized protein (DUF2249 family)